MTKEEIIAKVKALNLPINSYVIFGSAPLTVAGIREARDIDLLVTKEVFDELKKNGWQELYKSDDDKPITHDDFEAHYNWDFSPYNPTLKHLLESASIVDGVPFASLDEVIKWKTASGCPKHLADIELIKNYSAKK